MNSMDECINCVDVVGLLTTPPKEGNVPALHLVQNTQRPPRQANACHPSEGGECTGTAPRAEYEGLLKKCGIVRIQSLAPFGFGFHKLDG